jgi:protein phosphatase
LPLPVLWLKNYGVGTSPPFRLRATAITDLGLTRRQNEDRFVCDETQRLFGVADGVGGLPGGARAAQAAISTLQGFFREHPVQELEDWSALMWAAHEEVITLGLEINPRYGCASTLTCGTVVGSSLLLAHIGDSRCLLLRDGQVQQLTTDHSAENEHQLDPSLPQPSPALRRALARCLGQPDALRPDYSTHELQPGDIICFATDGITQVVGESELNHQLTDTTEPTVRLAALIDLAYARGAPDNATAVMIEILPTTHE